MNQDEDFSQGSPSPVKSFRNDYDEPSATRPKPAERGADTDANLPGPAVVSRPSLEVTKQVSGLV